MKAKRHSQPVCGTRDEQRTADAADARGPPVHQEQQGGRQSDEGPPPDQGLYDVIQGNGSPRHPPCPGPVRPPSVG